MCLLCWCYVDVDVDLRFGVELGFVEDVHEWHWDGVLFVEPLPQTGYGIDFYVAAI